jgi:hypothetical protein
MSYSTFATLLSVVIGFVAALFFCLGAALLTRRSIANLAGTYWDSNPHLGAFLSATRAEYLCGGIALCVTFLLQFFTSIPGALPEGNMFSSIATGASASIAAGLLVAALLWLLRNRLRAHVTVKP